VLPGKLNTSPLTDKKVVSTPVMVNNGASEIIDGLE
jgi:hypothetical protein